MTAISSSSSSSRSSISSLSSSCSLPSFFEREEGSARERGIVNDRDRILDPWIWNESMEKFEELAGKRSGWAWEISQRTRRTR
jgi:hypothetical protein